METDPADADSDGDGVRDDRDPVPLVQDFNPYGESRLEVEIAESTSGDRSSVEPAMRSGPGSPTTKTRRTRRGCN